MTNTDDCQQPSDNDLAEMIRKLLRRYFEPISMEIQFLNMTLIILHRILLMMSITW